MIPIATRRVVVWLQRLSVTLAAVAIFFVVGGLILTTTAGELVRASLIGLAFGAFAAAAFALSRWMLWRAVAHEAAEEDHVAT